jgi:hypothetical protein
MKRILSVLILLASSLVLAGETGLQGWSAQHVLNTLAKHLALSEDQKSKILPIIEERHRKIQEVETSSTLFAKQKQGQVRGINEESDRRINALLNGDQQKAYFALKQERGIQRRLRQAQSEQTAN